jgi:hypothetical protein
LKYNLNGVQRSSDTDTVNSIDINNMVLVIGGTDPQMSAAIGIFLIINLINEILIFMSSSKQLTIQSPT